MDKLHDQILDLKNLNYYIIENNNQFINDINSSSHLIKDYKLLLYYDKVASTMDIADILSKKGCQNGCIVIADEQESGRGRMSRKWFSIIGGLYFTIILRPDIPLENSFGINYLASLTLAKILKNNYKINARLKWPNDVLVDDKKIAGCLSEMKSYSSKIENINLGIGINVNNVINTNEFPATSIRQILGIKIPRIEFLKKFLIEFEKDLKAFNIKSIISNWKSMNCTIGKFVEVKTMNNNYKGVALDIDENGSLIIQLANKRIEKIFFGDCFHQKSEI